MRLLVVGNRCEEMAAASKKAAVDGVDIRVLNKIDDAICHLCSIKSADLILINVHEDIAYLSRQLQSHHLYLPVIAFGIDCEPVDAVNAIKNGARDFLPLPPDIELIQAMLHSVGHAHSSMVFADPVMQDLVGLASRFAKADAHVLISGESGTGKEVLARYLYENSARAGKPFISVNCAAIPDHLLESEMFGHEKGAFTGALTRRIGKFEEAHQGTLLLDEITEMDIRLQAKLLRAIQEKEIDRIGSSKPVPVDLRIFATTNRDIEQAIAQGHFREDLFFRLNILHIHLPPLCQRPKDIEVLSDFFLNKYLAFHKSAPRRFSENSRSALLNHGWKGNIRELENTVHRSVLVSTNELIEPQDLQLKNYQSEPSTTFVARKINEVEKDLILDTLDHVQGNRNQAAEILGISVRTLRNKLNAYQMKGAI